MTNLDYPVIHTGNSSQARMIEATGADVDGLQAAVDLARATSTPEAVAEAEAWLSIAQEDHAAALAGIDYRDLAPMGPESVLTEPEPCGYPTAEQAAELEAGL